MRAFADGKPIEFLRREDSDGLWRRTESPKWDWVTFDYRVAPEPEQPVPTNAPREWYAFLYPDGHLGMDAITEHGVPINGVREIRVREVTGPTGPEVPVKDLLEQIEKLRNMTSYLTPLYKAAGLPEDHPFEAAVSAVLNMIDRRDASIESLNDAIAEQKEEIRKLVSAGCATFEKQKEPEAAEKAGTIPGETGPTTRFLFARGGAVLRFEASKDSEPEDCEFVMRAARQYLNTLL